MRRSRSDAEHLTSIVDREAERDADRVVFTALDRHGDVAATLTAARLATEARGLAAALRAHAEPGARVLVPAMGELRFQVAFLACLYAGMIAVPVPPLRTGPATDERRRGAHRTASIVREVEPSLALVPENRAAELARAWAADAELADVTVLPVTQRDPGAVPAADDGATRPAFLQFTSGSTSTPRGAAISHRAMLANQRTISDHMGITPDTTIVSWLPTYHDMGLCLGFSLPLFTRGSAVLLEPETFVTRPRTWLHALSGLPDAMSASPDFGYAWCARRVAEPDKAGLDLSGWRVAVNGAEPVRPKTLRDFTAAFADCGLNPNTITPCYGLAEATLFVSGGTGAAPAVVREVDREALNAGKALPGNGPGRVELAGSGRAGPGVEVAIVEAETRKRCDEAIVGEIWVRSTGNADGYWRRPHDTADIFAAEVDGEAGHWLRTGDCGFVDDGELFVTGRLKDLIIVHGANYYPQDFEQLAQHSHSLLNTELAAAFPADDAERVTVVVEAPRRTDPETVLLAARAAVTAVTAELPVNTDVVIVSRNALPRTTSGKARRQAAAARLAEGDLPVLARWPR